MANAKVRVGINGYGVISAVASRVAVRCIRADAKRMIAKTVCRVLGLG